MKNKLPLSLLEAKEIENLNEYARDYLNKFVKKEDRIMLEIGGSNQEGIKDSWKTSESFFKCKYYNLDICDDGSERTIIGDITDCPEIPNNSYDFVFSMDTFEHITEPWNAAKEIIRILKPGGIVFVATLFAWRYHTVPIDFWRYTPHCLAYLFKDLDIIEANWDSIRRRANHKGDGSANDLVPVSCFEGICLTPKEEFKCKEYVQGYWLENWRVFYVGRKNEN